jgi:hypothetical protein
MVAGGERVRRQQLAQRRVAVSLYSVGLQTLVRAIHPSGRQAGKTYAGRALRTELGYRWTDAIDRSLHYRSRSRTA